jgi:hypothetical protein
MKQLIALTILLAGTFVSFAQNPWADPMDYTYIYQVETETNSYEFAAELTQNDENGKSFNWSMNLNDGLSGTVIMSPEAFESATKTYNYFRDGETAEMDDQTSVWISNMVYKMIINETSVNLDNGEGEKSFNSAGETTYHLDVNGAHAHVQAKSIQSEDGSERIDVLAASDYQNPLIMGMQFQTWSIRLIRAEKR